jgi:CheY-like chemotaxis protein
MKVSDTDGQTKKSPLGGCRILVIEDEYFLAEDICAVLRGLGANIVGPAGEIGEAIGIVNSEQCLDAAVLDVNLKNESIFPVADRLRTLNIPFVFTTGYARNAIDSRFEDIELFEKPIDVAATANALGKLIGQNGRDLFR